MKKRSLIFIIAILFMGFAGISNVRAENYDLSINDVPFTSENTTYNGESGTATYDYSTNTLTFNNIMLKSHTWNELINYEGTEALHIVLIGENTLINGGDYAISSRQDIIISGTGSLLIDAYNGICAYDSKYGCSTSYDTENIKNITFESSNVEIKTLWDNNGAEMDGVGIVGNIISEHNILAGPYGDNRDATVYKANELYQSRVMGWINYLKIGNFTTNNIKNDISTSKFINIPKQAVNGSKIRINTASFKLYVEGIDRYDGTDSSAYGVTRYYFNVSDIRIIKTSTGEDVTKTVKYNTTYNTFTMPNYDITIKGKLVRTYKNTITNLTKKINSSNNLTMTWKSSRATGYYIYAKKGNSTSWELLGEVKHKTFAPGNEDIDLNVFTEKLDQNTRYAFKILPYFVIPEGIFKDVKVASSTYKTTNYMFTKMNLPVVEKYSNGIVRVKWTKVSGATKYQIARSVYKTRNYKTVKTVGSGYIGYRLNTKANKTYYYKVRACNGTVCGPWSNYKYFRLK